MNTQNHNPDNLTEWGQSEGWRLLTVEEAQTKVLPSDAEYWFKEVSSWEKSGLRGEFLNAATRARYTYRTREPLPSQPSDDLSYYETELPKVIAGVRRGEKWEVMWLNPPDGNPKWVNPIRHDVEYLLDQINYRDYRVRLAPVPVVKEWDSVEDFPATTVWLRWKSNRKEPMMALGVTEEGIQYAGLGYIRTAAWENMEKLEHSTDLRNWHPCVKPEGGK